MTGRPSGVSSCDSPGSIDGLVGRYVIDTGGGSEDIDDGDGDGDGGDRVGTTDSSGSEGCSGCPESRASVMSFHWKQGGWAMRMLQEVLWKLESGYMGHPYYVPGHALWTALVRQFDEKTGDGIHVSNGVFVPGARGECPAAHSRGPDEACAGTGLEPVTAYDDLFLFRDAAHRWLLDSQPRDAHNTHVVRNYAGRTALASTRKFGRPSNVRAHQRTMDWHVHCFIHVNESSKTEAGFEAFPIKTDDLDGLQVGGARNHGFGELEVIESQTIDLDKLDYSRLIAADQHRIELLSPFVLTTEYADADSQPIPWWWGEHGALRRRTERLVEGDSVHTVETIDHGQVVAYAGDDPVMTAKNGVRRIGTHKKFGFGELRLRPMTEDRVPDRRPETESGSASSAGDRA